MLINDLLLKIDSYKQASCYNIFVAGIIIKIMVEIVKKQCKIPFTWLIIHKGLIYNLNFLTLYSQIRRLSEILTQKAKNRAFTTNKFIDFDKEHRIFYNNLYLEDFKIVVKMPCAFKDNENLNKRNFKIEQFDLGKYTYLLSYDQKMRLWKLKFFTIILI